MDDPSCIKHPDREATYNIPDNYCDVCWEMWATVGYTHTTEEELRKIRCSDLYQTWKDHGSPGKELERQMIIEISILTNLEYKGLRGVYRWFSRLFNRVRMFLTES
jgi:hypothetical protein